MVDRRSGFRIDDDGAVHAVRDVREHRLRTAVVHVDAGVAATKRKVNDSPGAKSRKARFGAIRAAWKSIECGIGAPFISVISTVWPSRTWTIGPGAPWPSNAQVL